MAWELRHGGHQYLYRSRRVNGKPVKEYLAAASNPFGFPELMEDQLGRLQRREAKLRRLKRRAQAEYRAGLDELLDATAVANHDLRSVADGLLTALARIIHTRGQ